MEEKDNHSEGGNGRTDGSGGAPRRETIHNQHRRSFWHDYRQPGLYMVTMVIAGRQRLFGKLVGTAKGRPGSGEEPRVELSVLGRRVLEQEVPKISRVYREVEVWRVAMMPDHIHLLLWVREALPEGKSLGQVVRGFKTGCSRAWWAWQDEQAPAGKAAGTAAAGKAAGTAAVPKAFPLGGAGTAAPAGGAAGAAAAGQTGGQPQPLRPVLFEKGYHDRIINRPGMLENIKRYMQENPLRARIRQECPRLMERQLHLWIAGREYAAFGNLFLLKYPIKEQVFFHRKDKSTGLPTEETDGYRQEHDRLLRLAEEGAVLVTPGISKGEQLVVADALDTGLPLIIIQKEPIGEYWKPAQHRFYACAAGHLLILAPWQVDDSSDYASFHQLNDFAREVCDATAMRILGYSLLAK